LPAGLIDEGESPEQSGIRELYEETGYGRQLGGTGGGQSERARVGGNAPGSLTMVLPTSRTLIILQYRPPIQNICVELPAGLIDEGESPEQSGIREGKTHRGR
jgi:8-oxo-dGTP pyrophosphatase MutT (NUDIX family)